MIDVFNNDEAGLRYGVPTKTTLAIHLKPARAGNSPLVLCKYDEDTCILLQARSSVPNYSITFNKWLLHWVQKVIKEGWRITLVLDNATIKQINLFIYIYIYI